MNNQNITPLYNRLTELVDAGDEQAVRNFLTMHIKEFPVDIQKKIAFEFFEEALDKNMESAAKNAQIQKEGIETLGEIDKVQNKFKNSQKMGDTLNSLGL